MKSPLRITVCTPTYNRGYILGNLYDSLCRQSFRNFEWLIIDDGSADDTEKLAEVWIRESKITIRYNKQENGGKHRAVNKGLQLAQGEIFMVMDSDDLLTSDALQKIDQWFEEIKDQPEIMGITANKGTACDITDNHFFSTDFLDLTFLQALDYQENGKHVADGERAIAFYTDFHKKYLYPEFENEKFMTEAVVYNRMAHDGYKMRYFNDIIWIYEYREDGLTKAGSSIFLNNPEGYGLWLREKSSFLQESIIQRLKMYYTFTCDMEIEYSCHKIARCIDAPYWLILLIKFIHQLKNKIKKRICIY